MRCKGMVLLAEDDADQRELLGELLEHEGYRVVAAHDASELLARLALKPDVVLLDLVGVANPEVFRALSVPDRPALVLVSGDHRLAQVADALGADAYVGKPYDVGELLRTLEATLEARALAREAMAAARP